MQWHCPSCVLLHHRSSGVQRIACSQYDFEDKALSPGGFAYSAGESLLSSWHFAGANHSVYGDTIALVGGKTLSADRQRPKLLFTDGVPSYLFNGLDPHGQKGPTHTFAVRIKSWVPPYDTHDTAAAALRGAAKPQ